MLPWSAELAGRIDQTTFETTLLRGNPRGDTCATRSRHGWDAMYRTLPERDHRAITGKSSGGYAAMVTSLLRPDVFGAPATHAGDASFEVACAVIAQVWQRWLALDPVRMAAKPRYADALRSLRAVWIDAGKQDECPLAVAWLCGKLAG